MNHAMKGRFLAVAFALAACGFGQAEAKDVEVVAVYYPHWHAYPKGDEWFHKGWTEWEFVKTAKNRFPGQKICKPYPGYLDGTDPRDVGTEIALASASGIDVFLWDYYWYDGQVTQEEALQKGFLCAKNRDKMKFALMWCYHEREDQFRPANDGKRRRLMTLAHTPGEFLGLIDHSITNYFGRPEYWRKDGKLFFSIFNAPYLWRTWGRDDAKVKAALAEARRRVKAAGLGEIHFNAQGVAAADTARFAAMGFDSFTNYNLGIDLVKDSSKRMADGECVFDYGELDGPLQAHWKKMREASPVPYFPVVSCGWDSTYRCRAEEPFPWKAGSGYPYTGSFRNVSPEKFEKYLRDAKAAVLADPKKPGVVYINAWNEYTEGAWLLPDVRRCDFLLRCVGRVFGFRPADQLAFCDMKHWWRMSDPNGGVYRVEMPTLENLKYGPHMRQGMDVWLPKDAKGKKVPMLIDIHGGGWCDGYRLGGVPGELPKCRAAGVALAAITYRMVSDAADEEVTPRVKACLDDAVAAIRFIQAHADEWGVDPKRLGLTGGSAGACSSLYAALQNDCELGIKAVFAMSPQTSLDPKETREWIPNATYGGHAFGFKSFDEWLKHREEILPLIETYSPAALLRRCTPARAPTFLYTCPAVPADGALPPDPTHAGMFCVKFKEICDRKGIVFRKGTMDDIVKVLAAPEEIRVTEKNGAAIQRAIDAASANGGGRVTLLPGEYPSRTLRLKSGVDLHLEKGAVIKGSGNPLDYTPSCDHLARIGLIQAWDAENIAITGEGTVAIDGASYFDRSAADLWGRYYHAWEGPRPEIIQFLRCRGIRLEGVSFLDSPFWTMRLRKCDDITVDGIKVINDLRYINADGIDFDGCRRVTVRRSKFVTGDDCLILRAIPDPDDPAPIVTEDVLVEDCDLESACQAIRIGCPSDDTIRNAVFRNIRAKGRNGIFFENPLAYLSENDEGRMDIRNVTIENFTGEFYERALNMSVAPGIALRGIRDVTFRNIDVKTRLPLIFVGNARSKFERIRRENFRCNGELLPDGEIPVDCTNNEPLKRYTGNLSTEKTRPRPDGLKFANPKKSY